MYSSGGKDQNFINTGTNNTKLKVPMTRIFFFLRKYLAYLMFKPIPIEKKIQNTKTRFFRALKCSYFILKVTVDW